MRTPSSCRLCNGPLVVESASGLCPTCLRSEETHDSPPAPSLGSLLLGSEQPASAVLDDATASVQDAVETPTVELRAARPAELPRAPSGYDLIRRLGTGGMGEVYLARERTTNRIVAMKFLRAVGGLNAVDRFQIEVQALAALDHPNVVRVLATDFLRTEPFFTMEVAEGGSLAKWIEKHGPIAPTDAARLVAAAARAIDAAHGKNILHRDLKPSNILLHAERPRSPEASRDEGEPGVAATSLAAFTPKVSDFGLAKRLDYNDGATVGTGPLGTPGFMPPEQVSRRNGELGPASDVYGLGATLFYLLTGKPPFGPGEQADVMHQVLTEPAPRPRAERPDVPPELDGIVIKCLEKDPADRYPTARALAEDLERVLAGETPAAPAMTRRRRARRWIGRNRKPFGTALALLALSVILGTAGTLIALRLNAAPARTNDPEAAQTARTDPLDAIRTELAAGRPVNLIAADGSPKWSRWALGSGMIIPAETSSSSVAYSSQGLAFLELLPDPLHDHYRITAELRHLRGGRDSHSVGLFAGFDTVVGSTRTTLHPVVYARYSEFLNDTEIEQPHLTPRHNAHLVLANGLQHDNQLARFESRKTLGVCDFIPTDGTTNPPWRTIILQVSPNGIEAFWQDIGSDPRPLGTLAADRLASHRRAAQRDLLRTIGDPSPVVPDWHPRRPVGLYILESTVTIRRLTIEPILRTQE